MVMFLSTPELTSYNHAYDLLDSIYLDPHDCGGNFELKSHHLGVKMNYQGWDPSLWMRFLDYFSIAVSTCTWDTDYFSMVVITRTWDLDLWTNFLDYWSIETNPFTWDPISLDYFIFVIRNHTWDPHLLLYIHTTSIEENTFQRGMECWGP
jgi:hypothetical protein